MSASTAAVRAPAVAAVRGVRRRTEKKSGVELHAAKGKSVKPRRRRWRTGDLTKLCLFVSLVVGLPVWLWSRRGGPPLPGCRLSRLEESLEMSVKMLQLQIEVVEKKIDSEIVKVRNDVVKLSENRKSRLEAEVASLRKKAEELGGALDELKAVGLVPQEEFHVIRDEVRRMIAGGGGRGEVAAVDEVWKIVLREVERHAADGIGVADYALASGGARVTRHSEAYRTLPLVRGAAAVDPNARKMLEPSFGSPGECFALRGSVGFVEIKLVAAVIPEAITLEHVAKSVAYDRSSAPKDCTVTGWYEGPDGGRPSRSSDGAAVLRKFVYDIDSSSNLQTFVIQGHPSRAAIDTIRLDFSSNHGSPFTCIYRFRVHGSPADPPQPDALELA